MLTFKELATVTLGSFSSEKHKETLLGNQFLVFKEKRIKQCRHGRKTEESSVNPWLCATVVPVL